MSRFVSACTTLTKLDLAGNPIDCECARALLPSLHVRVGSWFLLVPTSICSVDQQTVSDRRLLQVTSSLEWLTIRSHPLHIYELKGVGKRLIALLVHGLIGHLCALSLHFLATSA